MADPKTAEVIRRKMVELGKLSREVVKPKRPSSAKKPCKSKVKKT